ncbi:MAG: DUF58 domain-containing protein [Puniceicoccales bacterium]|nr:DUF58 domain-containing protein [Puniceicoccales bacterium]
MKNARQTAQTATAVFRLPLGDMAWRGLHGQFASMGTGSSLDFQDHRPYFPGDDPRHINWQAYARTGSYTMKLYRQEVSPRVDLFVDISPSMFLVPEKRARVLAVVVFCAESALRLGASLQVHAAHGSHVEFVPVERLLCAEEEPWQKRLPGKTAEHGLALATAPFRHGSLRVLVSDLLFPGGSDALRPLAAGQGRGVVLVPWCALEAAPGWAGNHYFEDVESGNRERRRVTPSLLRRYEDAYARHFGTWRDAARRHGVRFARVCAEGDFIQMLRQEALPAGAISPG